MYLDMVDLVILQFANTNLAELKLMLLGNLPLK